MPTLSHSGLAPRPQASARLHFSELAREAPALGSPALLTSPPEEVTEVTPSTDPSAHCVCTSCTAPLNVGALSRIGALDGAVCASVYRPAPLQHAGAQDSAGTVAAELIAAQLVAMCLPSSLGEFGPEPDPQEKEKQGARGRPPRPPSPSLRRQPLP